MAARPISSNGVPSPMVRCAGVVQPLLATTFSVPADCEADVTTPGLLSWMTVVAVKEDETPCLRCNVPVSDERTLATERPAGAEPVLFCISTQAVEFFRA